MLERRRRGGVMNLCERMAQRASEQQLRAAGRSYAGQPVLDQGLGFRDADPLDRHRHRDAGEARARLARGERVERPGGSGELVGKVGHSGRDAGGDRIAPELGSELGVDQQPLDQPARACVVPLSG
jgi:hypothetical protein